MPRRGRRGRCISTRGSFLRRSPSKNEIPAPALEQPEAKEAAHGVDAAVDPGRVSVVRASVHDQGGVTGGVSMAGADRLVVRHKVSLIMSLPVTYLERIERIPGV